MKKSIRYIIISVIILLSITVAISCGFKHIYGIYDVYASQTENGDYLIEIKYLGAYGVVITNFSSDEKIYRGEQLLNVNEDLGEYIVKIDVTDTEMSKKLLGKYSAWTTYDLNNSNGELKFMWCYNLNHGISLYIGSSKQISVSENTDTDIKEFGRIKTTIFVNTLQ